MSPARGRPREAAAVAPSPASEAADRSPALHRSRERIEQQTGTMIEAATRLIAVKGTTFTTLDLAREAGIALKTFYKQFATKDHLLLAVFENILREQIDAIDESVQRVDGYEERLHHLITAVLRQARDTGTSVVSEFVATEHWRLSALFPAEVDRALQRFTRLIAREIRAAQDGGALTSADAERDARIISRLVVSSFHDHVFSPDPVSDQAIEDLWNFCRRALEGPSPS